MSESLSDDVFVENGDSETYSHVKCRSCGSDVIPGSWRRPSQKAKPEELSKTTGFGFFAEMIQTEGSDRLPRILPTRRPVIHSQSSRVELLRQMSQSSTCTGTSSHRPLNSCSEEPQIMSAKRSRLRNGIFGFLAFVAVFSTILLAFVSYPVLQSYGVITGGLETRKHADIYCTTPACLRASARILTRMDPTVDPCEDFYKFSCGNYLKTAYVPIDGHQMSVMQEIQDEVLVVLRNALEVPASSSDLEAEIKARTYYRTCMNEDSSDDNAGLAPLLKLLSDSSPAPDIPMVGQWPVLLGQLWDEQSAIPLDHLVANLMSFSTSTLFDIFLVHEEKTLSLQFFKVDPILDKEWYEELWVEFNVQSPVTNQFHDILSEIHDLDNNGSGIFYHNAIYDYINPSYPDYPDNQEKRKILSSFLSSSFNPKAKKSDEDQTEKTKIRKHVKAYRHLMEETVLLLSRGRKDLLEDVEDILSFESHLAKLYFEMCPDAEAESNLDSSDLEQHHDEADDKATLSDLSALVPSFNWDRMIESILGHLDPDNKLLLRDNLTSVGVSLQCREYFTSVFDLIQRTPKRTVYNYLIWRFLYNHLPYAGEQLRHLWTKFRLTAIHHTDESVYSARWKSCVEATNQGFGAVIARMALQNEDHSNLKREVMKVTEEVTRSFENFVLLQPWIESNMKDKLIEKVSKMEKKIAFPDLVLNSSAIEDEYSNLEIRGDSFLGDTLRLRKRQTSKELLKTVEATDPKTDWLVQPFTVNAFHNPATNEVILPAGILREPVYHSDYPSFLLYSNLGVVVGHEIIHGFDDNGRRHDAAGNISSWWSDSLASAFRERASCFVQQYGEYNIDAIDRKVDGNMTLGDNICDNSGLALAYRAYEQRKSFEIAKKLPGLSGFSDEQLFFISYGQIWCEVMDETGYEKYTREVHSPGEHRTNGALKNSKAFSSTFGCPGDSPMNPVEKCSLWGE